MSIRLVVIDGHTLIRYAVRCLVEQQQDIEMAGESSTAEGAAALVAELEPNVVTVDVALPDGNGLALARELRDRFHSLGIVVLTSQGEDDVLFRALETGVSAFVPKTAPVEEILGAIRHAAVAASSFTAAGLADALARRRDVSERLALSPREREVLRLLQDGLSIPTIARTMYVSQSTAKTYVARLYDKLGASSRAQALMTALQLGLIQYQAAPDPRAGSPAGLGRATGSPPTGSPATGSPATAGPVGSGPAGGGSTAPPARGQAAQKTPGSSADVRSRYPP
jgi:DNA-binding NarL/FixJ family response regulator